MPSLPFLASAPSSPLQTLALSGTQSRAEDACLTETKVSSY